MQWTEVETGGDGGGEPRTEGGREDMVGGGRLEQSQEGEGRWSVRPGGLRRAGSWALGGSRCLGCCAWGGRPPPEGQALVLGGWAAETPKGRVLGAVCSSVLASKRILRCYTPCSCVPSPGASGQVLWDHPSDQCWAPGSPRWKQRVQPAHFWRR